MNDNYRKLSVVLLINQNQQHGWSIKKKINPWIDPDKNIDSENKMK